MALTNKGFNGTVTEADFAFMGRIGMAEGVESSGAWAVTQGTGRQTSTAAQNGWAFSAGVVSKDSAAILTSLSTPTNGQWFLIVRRINWATDTVTVVAIAHTTTTTTIPTAAPAGYPTMSTTPGTEWDQKLAWAWVRSTDTTMFLVDLRNLPLEDRLAVLPAMVAGVGRGARAIYSVVAPTDLDAISTALIGDLAYMTTPGTGIDPMYWVAFAGSGATIDWRPAGTVVAATEANLTTFIAAIVGISDTTFQDGGQAYVSGTNTLYAFVSTAGALEVLVGKTFIQYTSASAVTWPSTLSVLTGLSTAAFTDTGAFTVASGVYTCVRAGRYKVDLSLGLSNVSISLNMYLEKNSVSVSQLADFGTTVSTTVKQIHETVSVAVGDTLRIRYITNGGSTAGTTGVDANHITITSA